MNKMMNKIKAFFIIFCLTYIFIYVGICFTDGLVQQHQKDLKRERMSFVKDSLEVEYYKLKIDTIANGK